MASSPYGPNPYYGNFTVETTTFDHAYEPEAENWPEKDISITLENEGVYDVVKGDDKEDGNASSNENGKVCDQGQDSQNGKQRLSSFLDKC